MTDHVQPEWALDMYRQDRIQVAIAHAQSAQQELERGNHGLAAIDLARAVRMLLASMVDLVESGKRDASVCSPQENAQQARQVVDMLRNGAY